MLTPWKESYDQPRQHIQRRQWHPTPVLMPGKSHGWRSVVGYSPWGRKELDTTERLQFQLKAPESNVRQSLKISIIHLETHGHLELLATITRGPTTQTSS